MASPFIEINRIQTQNVRLTIRPDEGNGILAGTEYRGKVDAPLFWFVHGFQSERMGNKAGSLLETAVRLGWSFTSFDFRGHGESSPTITGKPEHPLIGLCHSSLIVDMDVIATHLDTWHTGPRILIGSSMGGYASAWHAALHPKKVQGLVLVAPAWRFGNTILSRVEKAAQGAGKMWWKTGWHDYQGGISTTRLSWRMVEESEAHPYPLLARRLGCPVRILHAMDDDVIDYQESLETLKLLAGNAELVLTRTGGHRLIGQLDRMTQIAIDLANTALEV